MLWLTVSNAIDKSINNPNVYLFLFKSRIFYLQVLLGHVRLHDLFQIQIVYETANCF